MDKLKKIAVLVLSLALILTLSFSSLSEDLSESINVFRNQVSIEVNDQKVDVDNFLYDGITYIPLRSVSEILGKYVGWNTNTNMASINDKEYKLEELSNLLPNSKGFIWRYDGFAEYGHVMTLNKIVDGNDMREYLISGEVGDPSDGEGSNNLNLNIKYIIEENKLIQEKTEEAMMDSKFDKMILIQSPLVAGTYWNEEVTDKNATKTTLNAYIKKIEINENSNTEYTVRYDDANSDYYEIRTIETGIGIVNFEKLLELEDTSFPVSYFLFKTENESVD